MFRDFVNTRLLVHKHGKISVDEWILESTRPHKHVTIYRIFFVNFFLQNKTGIKIVFSFSTLQLWVILTTNRKKQTSHILFNMLQLSGFIYSKLWMSGFQCGQVDFGSHSST